MKYLEIFIAITCWVIAVLWFNDAPLGEFPYEPLLAVLGGLVAFCDSALRFGFFARVNILMRNSSITPWSFSGGKIDKTNVSTEIFIENNKKTDVLIESIELKAPVRINNSIGESSRRFRFVDLANIGSDIILPIIIPSGSTKLIIAESTHDATYLDKDNQTSNLGKLEASEFFDVVIKYSDGLKEKIITTRFSAETKSLVSKVRINYESSGDHKCIVKTVE